MSNDAPPAVARRDEARAARRRNYRGARWRPISSGHHRGTPSLSHGLTSVVLGLMQFGNLRGRCRCARIHLLAGGDRPYQLTSTYETVLSIPEGRVSMNGVGLIARANRISPIAIAVLLAVLAAACGAQSASVPYIDLSQREPVAAAIPQDGPEPLRVAVAAVLSPEGNIDSYAGLATYLGERLDRPVELVQRRTYAEVNHLIADGAVDVAFVCTSAYVVGSAAGEMELLLIPEVDGDTVYHSTLIVPADSSAETLADLRGMAFAFTDPMSLTGRVYPTHLVEQLGSSPDAFFGSTFFTYSHDRAIQAVADGIADGAAVDSLVLEHALEGDSDLAGRLKVIHRSPPFGIPPVVVPAHGSPELRSGIKHALLELGRDAVGAAILAQIGVDRFVLGTDAAYDDARSLVGSTELET